jgi:hypothetical protein
MVKGLLWLILMISAISCSCCTVVSTNKEKPVGKMDQHQGVKGSPEKDGDFATQQIDVLRPFEEGGRWGYLNGSGQVMIPPRYVVAGEFSAEGLAAVADQQKWMYIDRTGQTVIEPYIFDNGPDYFVEGLARFVREGKFGFFDQRGQVIIEPRYDFARPFFGGRAAVCEGGQEIAEGEHQVWKGGRWGYIDKQGLLLVPMKFESAGDFEAGKAEVILQGERREIDERGEIVR